MDSLVTIGDSKECPGICVHKYATIICYEVLEDIPCPSDSMRCCLEHPPGRTNSYNLDKRSFKNNFNIFFKDNSTKTDSQVISTTTTTSTTTTKRPTTTITTTEKITTTLKPYKEKESFKEGPCSPPHPSVCVSNKIVEYCEAYLTRPGLCKTGSKCCVSRSDYQDDPPDDLYVPVRALNTTPVTHKTTIKKSETTETVNIRQFSHLFTLYKLFFPAHHNNNNNNPKTSTKSKPKTAIKRTTTSITKSK